MTAPHAQLRTKDLPEFLKDRYDRYWECLTKLMMSGPVTDHDRFKTGFNVLGIPSVCVKGSPRDLAIAKAQQEFMINAELFDRVLAPGKSQTAIEKSKFLGVVHELNEQKLLSKSLTELYTEYENANKEEIDEISDDFFGKMLESLLNGEVDGKARPHLFPGNPGDMEAIRRQVEELLGCKVDVQVLHLKDGKLVDGHTFKSVADVLKPKEESSLTETIKKLEEQLLNQRDTIRDQRKELESYRKASINPRPPKWYADTLEILTSYLRGARLIPDGNIYEVNVAAAVRKIIERANNEAADHRDSRREHNSFVKMLLDSIFSSLEHAVMTVEGQPLKGSTMMRTPENAMTLVRCMAEELLTTRKLVESLKHEAEETKARVAKAMGIPTPNDDFESALE